MKSTSINFVNRSSQALPLPLKKRQPQVLSRTMMTITPEMADGWLKSANTRNRPMSEVRWMTIACDIIDGRWIYDATPIKFDKYGVLIDGQHRLKACVESKVAIVSDVVFGLEPEAMLVTDTNMVRTAAQIAHLSGVQNAPHAASIALLVLLHKKHHIKNVNNPWHRPTKVEVVGFTRSDRRIAECIPVAERAKKSGLPVSICGFCYYLFSEQDKEKADRFFEELGSGANLDENNPVYRLRERIRENSQAKRKLPKQHIIALIFRAWSNYRKGRSMKLLKTWRDNGPNPEAFPEI